MAKMMMSMTQPNKKAIAGNPKAKGKKQGTRSIKGQGK